MPRIYQRSSGREPDLRALLLRAGVGQFTATMSVPYMNMLPSTTDPYAQGVQQIVKGLQHLLNERGARLALDGGLGARTLEALVRFAGPRWHDKSWAQLYGDVVRGEPWRGEVRNDRAPHGLGLLEDLGSLGATESELIARRDALLKERLASAGYCTMLNRPVGCTPVSGIAKPMTVAMLETFKMLQYELSRLLSLKKQPTVGMDGRIGPNFVRGLDYIRSHTTAGGLLFPQRTVDEIAAGAASLLTTLRGLADTLGAPRVVVEVPTLPPSRPAPGGGVIHPPDDQLAQAGLNLSSPIVLAAVGVSALLLLRGRGASRRRPSTKKRRR